VILCAEHKSVVAQVQNAELPVTAVSLLRVRKRRPTNSWRQHLVTGGTRWRGPQLCRSLSNWTLPGGSLCRHCLRPATPLVALTSRLIMADLIVTLGYAWWSLPRRLQSNGDHMPSGQNMASLSHQDIQQILQWIYIYDTHTHTHTHM